MAFTADGAADDLEGARVWGRTGTRACGRDARRATPSAFGALPSLGSRVEGLGRPAGADPTLTPLLALVAAIRFERLSRRPHGSRRFPDLFGPSGSSCLSLLPPAFLPLPPPPSPPAARARAHARAKEDQIQLGASRRAPFVGGFALDRRVWRHEFVGLGSGVAPGCRGAARAQPVRRGRRCVAGGAAPYRIHARCVHRALFAQSMGRNFATRSVRISPGPRQGPVGPKRDDRGGRGSRSARRQAP